MNWLKLLRYDMRHGVMRWRYLCAVPLFWMSCFACWVKIINTGFVGGWMDYLLGCFQGIFPLESVKDLEFPVLWFVLIAGVLFLNVDYPINDLTDAGQQVIVRCVNKNGWFLSKCMWCLISTGVYMLLGVLTALVFALINGGTASLTNQPNLTLPALSIYTDGPLPVGQAAAIAVGIPYLTIAALGMVQLTLSLVIKPVLAFLVCVCVPVVSLFVCSPYMLGNGAMVLRSSVINEIMPNHRLTAASCAAVIGICIVVGLIRFRRMDHLRYEE